MFIHSPSLRPRAWQKCALNFPASSSDTVWPLEAKNLLIFLVVHFKVGLRWQEVIHEERAPFSLRFDTLPAKWATPRLGFLCKVLPLAARRGGMRGGEGRGGSRSSPNAFYGGKNWRYSRWHNGCWRWHRSGPRPSRWWQKWSAIPIKIARIVNDFLT